MFASFYIKKLSFFCSLNQQQTENKAQKTDNDLAKQQSALEDGLSRLRVKLQRNQEQAIHVGGQAESAQRQAGGLEEVISPTPPPRAHSASLKLIPYPQIFVPFISVSCSAGTCSVVNVCRDPDGREDGGGLSLEKAEVLWPNPIAVFTAHPLVPGFLVIL